MADWTSRPIKDLKEGDVVVAFDEGSAEVGRNKIYEKALVERVWWSRKPAVRIETDDGGFIVASVDHRFLKPPRGWFKAGNARVYKTRLRRIACAEPAGDMSDDYCAGYIVGASDGDGTMSKGENGKPYREKQWYWRVAVAHKQREFIERLISCATRFGVRLAQRSFSGGTGCEMIKVETRRREDIRNLSSLWDRSGTEFSKGYLAGIFDAEGHFGKSGGSRPTSLRIANTDRTLLNAIVEHGQRAGHQFSIENFHGRYCKTARLYGSLDGMGKFLGETRPALAYKKEAAFGCRIEGRTPRVVSVEYLGERELVDIQTSKRTFVANGYLTHNCYAERMAKRLRAMGQPNYRNGFRPTVHPHMLDLPLHWRQPRMIFVNSMSDLFHQDVPLDFILKVFDVVRRASQHCFQILTKRSERLAQLSPRLPWPDNVWMGVTVENDDYTYRIEDLRRTDAAVKFISFEPLIGPVSHIGLGGIDWAIVGGESGPGARPMKSEWVIEIRDQCLAEKIPFFFKQWGGVNKKANGRSLEGHQWDEMPSLYQTEAL
jgi:protein gp37